ncbi:PilY2 family type 4a fimbrial biogenesis protein [Stutzerimonas balearica]|jgi:hypothetical protein|uniref:PilY2 family type 4a fimbrial biogenesis protein n=1 Tax=Stutzerimonas balearica TaxID=74829 RepID=A0A9X7V5K8_9GAMM|nr:PilY2 family type 4a fimbrial biogenesis protein [Stutzerimonas balearica]WIX03604.1 PilY2 family type 4a fimbrial biogenesis protein [Pseudomonas sp. AR5]MBD3734944.1 PilY2 family type 4a fimbrial biogenesis protein [Stutzerimonas balearica]MCF6758691.1 PilY2 family type 4a fimbrial biogenesis protein [Stutzerimonas balearica]MCZ4126438.1 PilY2 family type 4a fimbrial biogenesis protein [Stutzerimonas balearica]OMG68990.1 hypothetical protein AUR59_002500 [Stutzerimonas balearica]
MTRRNSYYSAIVAIGFASGLHAATFEAVGTISDVQLGRNLIVVDRQAYSLPNKTLLGGSPAILQLKPGYLVGFSGTEASPHSIIDSLYLYPESVRVVEQREQSQ